MSETRNGAIGAVRLAPAEIERMCGATILAAHKLDYIDGVTTPDRPLPHRLMFMERDVETFVAALSGAGIANLLVIGGAALRGAIELPLLLSERPRECFAHLVRHMFAYPEPPQTAAISPDARIAPSAKLGAGVLVGAGSRVGERTQIYPNVVIGSRVRIGDACIIKSGTVIGQPGFGVYRDGLGAPRHLPQVGGVVIGDDVEIGALNTVASGTIHPTVVEDSVKIDDHVHIAHNCRIGSRTLVTACAEISGSVIVGADCWIGPNSSVRDGVTIGAKAYVGIGSNVVRDVAAGATVYGNPARERGQK